MRTLIIGAGATGGYFGGRLAQAGRDVTFLLHPRRAALLATSGLQLLSPHGDATVHPKTVLAADLPARVAGDGPFDLILLATKAYSLDSAVDDMAPAVGPATAILPILNGLRQVDSLATRFGRDKIVPGSVRIIADLDPEGRVHQLTPLGELRYGELDGSGSDRLQAIDRELRVPGYDAILAPDILAALWAKWVILASMGAICVLARGSLGDAASAPTGPAFSRAVVEEVAAISRANGYIPTPAALADQLARVTDPTSPLTSSLYRDMTRGHQVEADHILGDLLTRAQSTPAPLLNAAYVQLKVYEASRKS